MKRKFIIFIGILFIFIGIFFLSGESLLVVGHKNKAVFIEKRSGETQLYRNGRPFYIQGAGGKPLLKELSEAGGNTIRFYDTTNLKANLDKAKALNLAVIVDIPIPSYSTNYNPYLVDSFNTRLKEDVRLLVRRYKDHSALLFWNLGNEIKYPFVLRKNKFIKTFNSLIDIIHEEDENHLVGTSVSGTSKKQTLGLHFHSPQLDVIGFNVFGNLKDVKNLIQITSFVNNPKPYYFTEWGIHGPWEAVRNKWNVILELNSTQKANVLEQRYNDFIKTDKQSLGSVAFYWGDKIEGTPTWFNIFDSIGRKSESYYTLKSLWSTSKPSKVYPPKIKNLMLDGRLAESPIVLIPNESKTAEVYLYKENYDNLQFDWCIKQEAWSTQKWNNNFCLSELIHSKNEEDTPVFKFKVPEKEGPYRLFLTIYDKHNNFATANIPFYVLKANETE